MSGITYQTATKDQALLMDLTLGLMDPCLDEGGKFTLKRGDTALKVSAKRARLLVNGEWETIVRTDEGGKRLAPVAFDVEAPDA